MIDLDALNTLNVCVDTCKHACFVVLSEDDETCSHQLENIFVLLYVSTHRTFHGLKSVKIVVIPGTRSQNSHHLW